MQRRTLLTTTLSALLGVAGLAAPAFAQDSWPSKTIRFVVPYPPGGPTDLMARLLQGELTKRLGVAVVVDNKGGAGGGIGRETALRFVAEGASVVAVDQASDAAVQRWFVILGILLVIGLVVAIVVVVKVIRSITVPLDVHDGTRLDWEAGDALIVENACVHQHFSDDEDDECITLVMKAKPLFLFMHLLFQKIVEWPPDELPAGQTEYKPDRKSVV